jgi:hypothetical protein
MKKYLLIVFALNALTWGCFALSTVIVSDETNAAIMSAEAIRTAHLNTLYSVVVGLPDDQRQSVLRREGFATLPSLRNQLDAAGATLGATMQEQSRLRVLAHRGFTVLLLLSFLATLAASVPSLWRALGRIVMKLKAVRIAEGV